MIRVLDDYLNDLSVFVSFDDDETGQIYHFDFLKNLRRNEDGSVSFRGMNVPFSGSMRAQGPSVEDDLHEKRHRDE